ncbi:MAG TPA: LuxR C-terminal-related transcriptional regulator [Bacteroidia bacterium]|nr:LuxR C-terminal-related transcriptional regulator [Bacteroidia bacterium]
MRPIYYFIKNLKELYQTVPEGILITDSNGSIVLMNQKLQTFFKTSEKEWLDKPVSQFIPNHDPISHFKKLISKKALINKFAFRINKKEQSLVSITQILENEDDYAGMAYIFRLDKNYLPNNPYSNKNNPIVKVLNLKKNVAWLISNLKSLQTAYCSDSMENLVGWTAEEFTLGGWAFSFNLVHPQDQISSLSLMADGIRLRNEKKIVYDHIPIQLKFRCRTRENKWVWFDNTVTVLERDEKGNIEFIIGSIKIFDPENADEELSQIKLLEENVFIKDGKTFISIDALLEIQHRTLQNSETNSKTLVDSYHLSNRELEILSHIVNGLSSDEISEKLYITKNTVNMHRKQIMKKMHAKNLADLVRKSIESGLFNKKG